MYGDRMRKRKKFEIRRYRNNHKEIVQRFKRVIKNLCAIFFILLLIPYLIFICGNALKNEETKLVKYEKVVPVICIKTEGNVGEEYIPIEQYLIGELAATIDLKYDDEVLKAQSILLRSSLLRRKELGEKEDTNKPGIIVIDCMNETLAHFTLYQMQQLYGKDFPQIYDRLEGLVKSTEGVYITYNGEIIEGAFCALSAGKTRTASDVFTKDEYPYLQSVSCEYDMTAEAYGRNYYLLWEKIGDKEVEIIKKDSAGYVVQMKVADKIMSGEEFRKEFHLNSSNFELNPLQMGIQIKTKGIGHGFGMSQHMAQSLAEKKKDYIEILSYFYKNIEFQKQ